MVLKLKQNTSILKYLFKTELDRLTLNDFEDINTLTNSEKNLILEIQNKGVIHDSSFKIKSTKDIIFKFPKIHFNKFTSIKIILGTNKCLSKEELGCFLSTSNNGEMKNITCEFDEINRYDRLFEVYFKIPRVNKLSSIITNIQSIIFEFKEEISLVIHDIELNNSSENTASNTPLEMLESKYHESFEFINLWLTDEQMKEEIIKDTVIKLTAANLWLAKEENMTTGEMGRKNYYDLLMKEIERVICKFNPDFKFIDEDKHVNNETFVGLI